MSKVVLGLLATFVVAILMTTIPVGNNRRMSVSPDVSAVERLSKVFGTEVLTDVFDDGISTVYIRLLNPPGSRVFAGISNIDQSITYAQRRKTEWERKFPNKREVFGTFAVGGNDGQTFIYGLFIHYEFRNHSAQ